MGDRDDGWLPANEKLTPERAVRLLRAKGAELEAQVQAQWNETASEPVIPRYVYLAADIALIAQLLADHIERSEHDPEVEAAIRRIQREVGDKL